MCSGRAFVVPREELECEQVPDLGDGQPQPGGHVDHVGGGHDLGFDARRGEQEVDDLPGCGQPKTGGCKPACRVVLNGGHQAVATVHQCLDRLLGRSVVGHGHGQIDVLGEPWRGTNGHREAADQREVDVGR